MESKNIVYRSNEILEYFRAHRQKWEEFYPSERWVIERVARARKSFGEVLDVGCACGGLGSALNEKFTLSSYTGVDIHTGAIEWAQKQAKMKCPFHFFADDIVTLKLNKKFDTVVSFGCADWNIETEKIIERCWEKVKQGGYYITSLRLTCRKGINNIKKSYQYIDYSGKESKPEIANYVVLNFREILTFYTKLSGVEFVGAYGYWGKPSATAVTPFSRLVFAVFYIKKGKNKKNQDISSEFCLPLELFQ